MKMTEQKLEVLHFYFDNVVDKGSYFSCTMNGKPREWMYSKKMIEDLGHNKLLQIIKNQT